MTDVLLQIHPWFGYAVSLAVLVVAVMTFSRARDSREFLPGPIVGALVALDIQVLLGIVLYGMGGAWDARPEIAYLHPLIAIIALGVGHASLKRAKGHQMAVEANRTAARGLVIALLLVFVAIGIASAPPFL
ncbi:MAG: hypothetical protein WDZ26_04035 [Nitriliruptoraceae bacterium]